MILDNLIAEGQRLVRPSIPLGSEKRGEIVGYWRGERADHPNTVPPEAIALRSTSHILTLDTSLLKQVEIEEYSPAIGFSEVETVHGSTGFRILRGEPTFAGIACDGTPLYALRDRLPSFPPFEALCLYGGEYVERWLGDLGLQRHEYVAAAGEPEAIAYQEEYRARSPLFDPAWDVVIGGWHCFWSDDDFYLPLEMRLAAITLRDAEPWYELWQATGHRNWSVRERIT